MNKTTAKFKVVNIDPDGSGMEHRGHFGMILTDAKRCCENCTIIFGTIGTNTDFGPFVIGELEPLNDEALAIMDEVLAKQKFEIERASQPLRKVIKTEEFTRSLHKAFLDESVDKILKPRSESQQKLDLKRFLGPNKKN